MAADEATAADGRAAREHSSSNAKPTPQRPVMDDNSNSSTAHLHRGSDQQAAGSESRASNLPERGIPRANSGASHDRRASGKDASTERIVARRKRPRDDSATCRCGARDHLRITHHTCPFNPRNQLNQFSRFLTPVNVNGQVMFEAFPQPAFAQVLGPGMQGPIPMQLQMPMQPNFVAFSGNGQAPNGPGQGPAQVMYGPSGPQQGPSFMQPTGAPGLMATPNGYQLVFASNNQGGPGFVGPAGSGFPSQPAPPFLSGGTPPPNQQALQPGQAQPPQQQQPTLPGRQQSPQPSQSQPQMQPQPAGLQQGSKPTQVYSPPQQQQQQQQQQQKKPQQQQLLQQQPVQQQQAPQVAFQQQNYNFANQVLQQQLQSQPPASQTSQLQSHERTNSNQSMPKQGDNNYSQRQQPMQLPSSTPNGSASQQFQQPTFQPFQFPTMFSKSLADMPQQHQRQQPSSANDMSSAAMQDPTSRPQLQQQQPQQHQQQQDRQPNPAFSPPQRASTSNSNLPQHQPPNEKQGPVRNPQTSQVLGMLKSSFADQSNSNAQQGQQPEMHKPAAQSPVQPQFAQQFQQSSGPATWQYQGSPPGFQPMHPGMLPPGVIAFQQQSMQHNSMPTHVYSLGGQQQQQQQYQFQQHNPSGFTYSLPQSGFTGPAELGPGSTAASIIKQRQKDKSSTALELEQNLLDQKSKRARQSNKRRLLTRLKSELAHVNEELDTSHRDDGDGTRVYNDLIAKRRQTEEKIRSLHADLAQIMKDVEALEHRNLVLKKKESQRPETNDSDGDSSNGNGLNSVAGGTAPSANGSSLSSTLGTASLDSSATSVPLTSVSSLSGGRFPKMDGSEFSKSTGSSSSSDKSSEDDNLSSGSQKSGSEEGSGSSTSKSGSDVSSNFPSSKRARRSSGRAPARSTSTSGHHAK